MMQATWRTELAFRLRVLQRIGMASFAFCSCARWSGPSIVRANFAHAREHDALSIGREGDVADRIGFRPVGPQGASRPADADKKVLVSHEGEALISGGAAGLFLYRLPPHLLSRVSLQHGDLVAGPEDVGGTQYQHGQMRAIRRKTREDGLHRCFRPNRVASRPVPDPQLRVASFIPVACFRPGRRRCAGRRGQRRRSRGSG